MSPHAASPSILAALPASVDAVVVRDGARTVVATHPSDLVLVPEASRSSARAAFDRIESSQGWWAGFAGYELGRAYEPAKSAPSTVQARTPSAPPDDLGVPDIAFARFDARMILEPGRDPVVEGTGPGRAHLERALDEPAVVPADDLELDCWTSSLNRQEWAERVDAIHELLLAGECYQVNLTRRLTAPREVDARSLFDAVGRSSPAPHAALVDFGYSVGLAVVSASPERFLARVGDEVETRPIKGTSAIAADLAHSEKDHAENVMIVDLARNDLGRVCRYGSVEVPDLCDVEHHPGLHHLVSTVQGRLRRETTLADLFEATFPAASITGAPKPRVIQAIAELEPVRRGVYCGAVGWIDAARRELDLNVAIRTFTITSGATHLGVGSGIVADSTATGEWDETCLKAHRLLAATRSGAPGSVSMARTGR